VKYTKEVLIGLSPLQDRVRALERAREWPRVREGPIRTLPPARVHWPLFQNGGTSPFCSSTNCPIGLCGKPPQEVANVDVLYCMNAMQEVPILTDLPPVSQSTLSIFPWLVCVQCALYGISVTHFVPSDAIVIFETVSWRPNSRRGLNNGAIHSFSHPWIFLNQVNILK
jgi:hypothetical protein